MADATSQPDGSNTGTPKAVKDRKCPYCNQAFTSSSLGRHLDLYIKPKNPKVPDGVHDVDEIRKLRGGITRRQPKKGSVSRRATSTSIGTPNAACKSSPPSEDGDVTTVRSPLSHNDAGQQPESSRRKLPSHSPWGLRGTTSGIATIDGGEGMANDERGSTEMSKQVPTGRAVNRQALKQQHEARQRIQDALDTAKASELALRELIGSWRAAKSVPNALFPFLSAVLTSPTGNK